MFEEFGQTVKEVVTYEFITTGDGEIKDLHAPLSC